VNFVEKRARGNRVQGTGFSCLVFAGALIISASMSQTLSQQAFAADPAGSDEKIKVVKPGEGRRKFIPVKVEERNAAGSLVGSPFNLVKASVSGNTLILDGGNMVASDPGKGHTKILIEFPTAQTFANETFQVRYNSTDALTAKGQTKAPKITYVTLDKSGAPVSTTATNGSKQDNLDYAMELRFSPLTKSGDLPGFIRLQIGSSPVSDVKGSFNASR